MTNVLNLCVQMCPFSFSKMKPLCVIWYISFGPDVFLRIKFFWTKFSFIPDLFEWALNAYIAILGSVFYLDYILKIISAGSVWCSLKLELHITPIKTRSVPFFLISLKRNGLNVPYAVGKMDSEMCPVYYRICEWWGGPLAPPPAKYGL